MRLEDIKNIRRNLGFSQAELAKLAGVSQAFVARIEASRTDPGFAKVQKVFSALEKVKTSLPASARIQDIMSKSVISIDSRSDLRKAARIMKRKNISQLPVIEKGSIIGAITEADISHAIMYKNPDRLLVRDIMKLPMPMIDIGSDVELLIRLLDYSPAVMITSKGTVAGIVTRADVLKLIRR